MDSRKRRTRIVLSVLGLICVAGSIALNFVAPGTYWNWALLLAALAFLLISRRAA